MTGTKRAPRGARPAPRDCQRRSPVAQSPYQPEARVDRGTEQMNAGVATTGSARGEEQSEMWLQIQREEEDVRYTNRADGDR